MTHSAAVLFAEVGNWLLARSKERETPETEQSQGDPKAPAPVGPDAERDRLPPRDESFYWAWQYWSQ
ncbi:MULTISPECIES: hypothetical protein [unclassified Mesorhizobium]|uniref:hypothetical protein n=1 Tax=unclassified Mesorhizobium TaxID=325217 RepID=UPI000FCBBA77|nr:MULTISPECIES: hypothetical protein [unclassified Mesorhizobium]TGP21890.1 hypothetical protein EN874_020635 [Mesorhizobium sp. M1D.F.Ca.ET.231.01.1.1]TGP30275.1 hypothetical protein EN877_19015 [Mesorhizobium sp. M1D.F.Ca.ET.234.01.1.1]TGS44351.1 hypothetical protein EN827_19010 [Mesorhizobium sp. M1D.F.Ca.ET.184.01.1.1]TGS60391.1 hypothetical protein EN826_019010 [Mesorhizobium sp. M1D.F.Ca.ET.183.01.1.1]